ncbi:BRISC and BRCA1-A complex member 1-like [Apostichopus japonicus]|uniref:BRISC and BRCA1-A complex member 1-like n=1 Tax=Stichopus japonicus TaxID=307972 RepID=UPI003AB54975
MDSPNPFENSPASSRLSEADNVINETNDERVLADDDLQSLQEHEYLENKPVTTAEPPEKDDDAAEGHEPAKLAKKSFDLSEIGRRLSSPGDDEDTSEPIYSPVTLKLPHINCQEKIIICIDLSEEVNRVPFYSRDGTKQVPLDVIKRSLMIYIRTKVEMNHRHQFALVIFQESFVWVQDFTSHIDDFLHVIQDLTTDGRESESCNLASLFETIHDNIVLPDVENRQLIPPPYTIRTLFIYGRSNVVPAFEEESKAQQRLVESPYFFFDVFYLHEPPSELNKCKEIFDIFLALDKEATSYIHEVGRNTTHVYDKFAMLLAHPLQRQMQEVCTYSIFPNP